MALTALKIRYLFVFSQERGREEGTFLLVLLRVSKTGDFKLSADVEGGCVHSTSCAYSNEKNLNGKFLKKL